MSIFSSFGKLFKKNSSSAIVYYGKEIDYGKLSAYKYIIVQGSNIDASSKKFSTYKKNIYAYISVCEMSREAKEYSKIKSEWVLSQNENWQSDILNIKSLKYQKFLFQEIIEPLYTQGFENFFFDTLDSYQMITKSKVQIESYERAIVHFIQEFAKRYPKAKLILNRGFEIIDEVHENITAILFESYYFGLGNADEPYRRVSDSEREWLDFHLEKVRYYDIDIITLDYLSENEFDKADQAIEVIRKKNMIPYVSNRNLDVYGIAN